MANKRQKKKRWKARGETLKCSLCGRLLWRYAGNFVSGRHGVVCHTCLHTGYVMTLCRQVEQIEHAAPAPEPLTPQQIMGQLDKVMAGQEDAKRAVSLAMWKQMLRAQGEPSVPAAHLLLHGPTGCGKTFLATQAAKLADLPCCVFDATTLSEAGYRGRDAIDILKDYSTAAEGHHNRNWGVVVLDEIDKLAAKGGSERQAYLRGTQHTLLKLLEGIPHEGLNSENLLFILCGAFKGIGNGSYHFSNPIGFLREQTASVETVSPCQGDFISFGMEPELMGRVPNLAAIQPLTEEDLVHILLDKEGSVFRTYQIFFLSRSVTLTLPQDAAEELARRALALGTGARALRAELDKVMEPLMFRLAAGELEGEVIVDVS